jgi:polysaccharide pyruvyl transferase WcaK-like protein
LREEVFVISLINVRQGEYTVTKILMYGVMLENNFGGPSLVHGAREIVKEVNTTYDITFYQSSKAEKMAIDDIRLPIYQIPYRRTFVLLSDALKYKYGIRPKSDERYRFLKEIKDSDIVANLFGINYSSNFDKGKYSYAKAIKTVIGKYSINFVAKMLGVKSVKCTASYGPITSKMDIVGAKFSSKRIFDVMVAREIESKKQMQKVSKKTIAVSPDLANLMPYSITNENTKTIGISISYQIIRQWNADEKYIDCIANLVNYIHSSLDYNVILIPNEMTQDNPYHDIHVAEEIRSQLKNRDKVEILDVANMSSSALKNHIAACEVMIASRYHSCVASLSSGVPTLVVGWHYKYDELLNWYGQNQWILSSKNCSTNELVEMFDKFWGNREENRMTIKEHYNDVRKALIDVGKDMFSV